MLPMANTSINVTKVDGKDALTVHLSTNVRNQVEVKTLSTTVTCKTVRLMIHITHMETNMEINTMDINMDINTRVSGPLMMANQNIEDT
jgi:hypothetical protein